jgi:small subunit ribosomal protein S17
MIVKNNKERSKKFIGKITSDKMDGTVIVEIIRRFPHPKYRKVVSSKTKLYADNKIKAKMGDVVCVKETRPISRLKRFAVIKKL